MSTDWEEMDRLDAFGTFGGRVIPYNGVWKIMLNETNCELWSLKTREEALAKYADAIKKSGYSDDENPLIELARLRATHAWKNADQYKPELHQEVMIYHCLGDTRRSIHAYDVAWWSAEKGWTFPWDRDSFPIQKPMWVVAWMPLPSSPDDIVGE